MNCKTIFYSPSSSSSSSFWIEWKQTFVVLFISCTELQFKQNVLLCFFSMHFYLFVYFAFVYVQMDGMQRQLCIFFVVVDVFGQFGTRFQSVNMQPQWGLLKNILIAITRSEIFVWSERWSRREEKKNMYTMNTICIYIFLRWRKERTNERRKRWKNGGGKRNNINIEWIIVLARAIRAWNL